MGASDMGVIGQSWHNNRSPKYLSSLKPQVSLFVINVLTSRTLPEYRFCNNDCAGLFYQLLHLIQRGILGSSYHSLFFTGRTLRIKDLYSSLENSILCMI